MVRISTRRKLRFNPRARVGRDNTGAAVAHKVKSFNPRARVGRDHALRLSQIDNPVSIHAPAWGATTGM